MLMNLCFFPLYYVLDLISFYCVYRYTKFNRETEDETESSFKPFMQFISVLCFILKRLRLLKINLTIIYQFHAYISKVSLKKKSQKIFFYENFKDEEMLK